MPRPESIALSELHAFPQLNPDAFQHPDDRKATDALLAVPAFPQVVKYVSGGLTETATHLHHLSHCIRVGPEQARQLYQHYVRAAEILSITELPDLYISPELEVNAYAMGMKKATILVTRGLVQEMSQPEVMAVLGHELGHVKCGHMVNKTLASLIAWGGISGIAQAIPVLGGAALIAVLAPLQYWSRMAELSCDRASLLVVQDPRIVAGTLAKLGGWTASLGDVDLNSLCEQADEYDRLDDNKVASVLKLVTMLKSEMYLSHPLPIRRVKRILLWGESDQYRQILEGNYRRLDQALPQPRCAECGGAIEPYGRHCPHCGTLAKLTGPRGPSCSICGFALSDPRPRFCGGCGQNLNEPGATTG